MSVHENMTFRDAEIHIDSNDDKYVNCTFIDCTLLYSGGVINVHEGILGGSTALKFEGPALCTILFLRSLNHGELSELGQSAFRQVLDLLTAE